MPSLSIKKPSCWRRVFKNIDESERDSAGREHECRFYTYRDIRTDVRV